MLLLEAEAAVAQLDPLNDILREEQVLGGSGASAGPGRQPLHGQEPSELLFPVPPPPAKGNRGALRRVLCAAPCLLSGFEARREMMGSPPRPLRLTGERCSRMRGPGGWEERGPRPRLPAPAWLLISLGLIACIVFWQVEEAGSG